MYSAIRSILAVVVGFVVIGALSFGTDAALYAAGIMPAIGTPIVSTKLLLLVTAYVAVYAIAGCWLTAFLAPSHPMRHALVEGVLGLVFTVASVATQWGTYPAWYNVLAIAVVMPYAWIGGRLREMQIERAGGRPVIAG
jgi:hypothetical protein